MKGLPLSLCTVLAGSARHPGTWRQKTLEASLKVTALDSEALTRESSQSTHGTGTGLYTLGYLLDRHLNRMFMLARAASMVPFPSGLAAAERELL